MRAILLSRSFVTSVTKRASTYGRVGYVTDIEGNYDFWQRYKAMSSVLESKDQVVYLKDGCQFVFGGKTK